MHIFRHRYFIRSHDISINPRINRLLFIHRPSPTPSVTYPPSLPQSIMPRPPHQTRVIASPLPYLLFHDQNLVFHPLYLGPLVPNPSFAKFYVVYTRPLPLSVEEVVTTPGGEQTGYCDGHRIFLSRQQLPGSWQTELSSPARCVLCALFHSAFLLYSPRLRLAMM